MIVTSSGSYVEGDDVCRVNEYSTRGCVDTMPCSARTYRGKAREGTTRNDASAESIRKKGVDRMDELATSTRNNADASTTMISTVLGGVTPSVVGTRSLMIQMVIETGNMWYPLPDTTCSLTM